MMQQQEEAIHMMQQQEEAIHMMQQQEEAIHRMQQQEEAIHMMQQQEEAIHMMQQQEEAIHMMQLASELVDACMSQYHMQGLATGEHHEITRARMRLKSVEQVCTYHARHAAVGEGNRRHVQTADLVAVIPCAGYVQWQLISR
jgi:hypothetical protein